MRKIGDYESQGFRPFTDSERHMLTVQEALYTRRARVRLLSLFAVPALFLVGLFLTAPGGTPPYVLVAMACAFIWLLLLWRFDVRSVHAVQRDLRDGRAEDFVAPDGTSGTNSAATGRAIAENSVLIHTGVFVPVATLGDHGEETAEPGRFEETELGTHRIRQLSPSELSELNTRFRFRSTQFVIPVLFTLYVVAGALHNHQTAQLVTWAWYSLLSVLGILLIVRLTVGQARGNRVLADARSGFVAVVERDGRRFEVLPKSRLVWKVEGKEAVWRTFPSQRPSRIPPKEQPPAR